MQNVKSLECIRQSIKNNLDLMGEDIKTIFQSYLTRCGDTYLSSVTIAQRVRFIK